LKGNQTLTDFPFSVFSEISPKDTTENHDINPIIKV
jgi:hypothetical protein